MNGFHYAKKSLKSEKPFFWKSTQKIEENHENLQKCGFLANRKNSSG